MKKQLVRNLAYGPKLTPINIFETRPGMSANVSTKIIYNIFLSMTRTTSILIYFFKQIETVGGSSFYVKTVPFSMY